MNRLQLFVTGLLAVSCFAGLAERAAAYNVETNGKIWMVQLDSAENSVVAVIVFYETLGSIPQAGAVFKTVGKLLIAADAAGGFHGTETFGVGPVVIVTLPPGNLWDVILRETDDGDGSERDERRAVTRLAKNWLEDHDDVAEKMLGGSAARAIRDQLGRRVGRPDELVGAWDIGTRQALKPRGRRALERFMDEFEETFDELADDLEDAVEDVIDDWPRPPRPRRPRSPF